MSTEFEIIRKFEWFGVPPDYVEELETPVSYVVLKYNNQLEKCLAFTRCCESMRHHQRHMIEEKDKVDVDYNFYIGGDGFAYEGRGWDVRPLIWDDEYFGKALTICYIGKFKVKDPPEKMVKTMRELIKYGIKNDYIKKEYTLIDRKSRRSKNLKKK